MAWHIVHGLLEQVRHQSTFPGKIWIVVMFIFRIVVVARIGEMVYHDEQSSFICNTLTPGCTNVCFNRFSPISQLRYWSLMVLVVSTPSIIFYLYAIHVVYHAGVKYPAEENGREVVDQLASDKHAHPPGKKRRRDSERKGGSAPPLYEVTKLELVDDWSKDAARHRHKHKSSRDDGGYGSNTDNNASFRGDINPERRGKIPIYNPQTRRYEFWKREISPQRQQILERKFKKRMLQHPELYRAYWWHVLLRLGLEVACLLGQYYLYGWEVHELYECPYWPCPKTVDCFVSRPQEKTCLLWLMYGLGVFATILSLCEFLTLGLKRAKTAFMCCMQTEDSEQRRKRLAMLNSDAYGGAAHDGHLKRVTSAISFDSQSSETTIESV